ncbi:MAG: hypothetical protein ACLFTV_15955, partial [Desulfococcaceae bacterium]
AVITYGGHATKGSGNTISLDETRIITAVSGEWRFARTTGITDYTPDELETDELHYVKGWVDSDGEFQFEVDTSAPGESEVEFARFRAADGDVPDVLIDHGRTENRVSRHQSMIGALATSTWTARESAADNYWHSVAWSPELGLFCAVASSGSGDRVMTSTPVV